MQPNHWYELTTETNPNQIPKEFNKKYQGCFVWYKANEAAEQKLVIYTGVDQISENEYVFSFDGVSENKRYTCKLDGEALISVAFPKVGAITSCKSYMVVSRIPARQYRKAPCRDNCLISSPRKRLFGDGMSSIHQNNLSSGTILDAFSPTFFDYKTAVALCTSGEYSGVAIGRRFGVIKSALEDNRSIFMYLDNPIGYAEADVIQLKVPQLEQEVLDFLKLTRMDIKVKV